MRHHIDRVGMALILYGLLNMLLAAAVGVLLSTVAGGLLVGGTSGGDQELQVLGGIYGVLAVVVTVFALLFSVPNVLVGAGLRRRQRWAWVGGLMCALLALSNLPLGTLVGVYALATLLDGEVREELGQAGG